MKYFLIIISIFLINFCPAQNAIDKVLDKSNKHSVPYITVEQLKSTEKAYILDARETKEYEVSHLKNSIHIGYDHFNIKKINSTLKNKNDQIIVYCSIGIRSEDIGEKLLKAGYKNVHNLYGGIFEWKNKGEKVVDKNNKETENIHTFNKEWSNYLKKGNKVYEN